MAEEIIVKEGETQTLIISSSDKWKISLRKGARMDLTLFLEKPFEGEIVIEQGESSSCEVRDFVLSERDCRLAVNLADRAHFEYYGLSILKKEQSSLEIAVNHLGKESNSKLFSKAILKEGANLFCKSQVEVRADKSVSQQVSKCLLVGKKSRAKIEPNLLVFVSNVKASHGAAISKMDADELFYLRSRGISCLEAKKLLSFGFIQELLAREKNSLFRKRIKEYLWT